ncbi:universal stress protein [Acidipila rosea]|uniref:Universal stress protein n=1 Tax=Acidipila rosea TaxID=768535 RepID=A0A4R1L5Y5_9BACT|nr:universal stress protein [Acidipila rosea]TCK73566.1 nucleotide-binding universal stress UspA family protein [Acidipila rosea]
MSFKRILIAVDESTFAAHAANTGLELARQLGAEVAFVTVVDPAVAQTATDSGVSPDRWLAMAQTDARNLLRAFCERAAATPPALEFLETGKPAASIVVAARNWPADLIVIGTHGRGTVGNLLLGSVAQGVLQNAHCPVMVIRAPKQT